MCSSDLEHCQGGLRSAWDDLSFYNPGYDYGYGRFIAGNEAVFSPLENPRIRIVYIYRNPLDQCVSFFHRAAKHRQVGTRSYIDRDGTDGGGGGGVEIGIADARDFLRRVGMEAACELWGAGGGGNAEAVGGTRPCSECIGRIPAVSTMRWGDRGSVDNALGGSRKC